MLIQGKILTKRSDLSEVYRIRREVFVNERRLPEQVEFDGQDDMAMHVIVYEDTGSKKAVATGRIYFDGVLCEIGHIAVLKDYRNKKYGDFTVRMLLNKAFTAGVEDVNVFVNEDTIDFFEKIGFHRTCQNSTDEKVNTYSMQINVKDLISPCHKMT